MALSLESPAWSVSLFRRDGETARFCVWGAESAEHAGELALALALKRSGAAALYTGKYSVKPKQDSHDPKP